MKIQDAIRKARTSEGCKKAQAVKTLVRLLEKAGIHPAQRMAEEMVKP